MKTAFKLATNDIQALSSLIGLPPVMERVIAGARKKEREELENERERETHTQREREREKERERERDGERGSEIGRERER